MRLSKTLIPTLREAPQDAEIPSHKLMMRAGLIMKLGGGLYTFLPAGLKALRKVEKIVREEMDRAGALEVLMPALQPREVWEQSGPVFHHEGLDVQDQGPTATRHGPRPPPTRRSSPTWWPGRSIPTASFQKPSTRSRPSSVTKSGPLRPDARQGIQHEGRL